MGEKIFVTDPNGKKVEFSKDQIKKIPPASEMAGRSLPFKDRKPITPGDVDNFRTHGEETIPEKLPTEE